MTPYFFGLVVTVGVLLIGHWFPWPHKLRRLEAYAFGVASILAGAGVWLGLTGQWYTLALLIGLCLAAGASVFLGYAVDWILHVKTIYDVHEDQHPLVED